MKNVEQVTEERPTIIRLRHNFQELNFDLPSIYYGWPGSNFSTTMTLTFSVVSFKGKYHMTRGIIQQLLITSGRHQTHFISEGLGGYLCQRYSWFPLEIDCSSIRVDGNSRMRRLK